MRKKLLLVRLLTCCLLFSVGAYAQTDVTGQVKDETGAPLPGAVVTIKGGRKAVTTSDNGSFHISAAIGATLVITHVGFAPKEVTVTDGTPINIALARQVGQLDEIVVTALGVKKEKKALSYSVTEVKGTDLQEARSPSVANQLEGKVAGLNVVSTATGVSGSTRLTLRGNGSVTQGNQPLIVVDGIPIDDQQMNFVTGSNNNGFSSVGMWAGTDQGDGISSLNPDEIESVSVLKGGTAAALYGSRASNGAILVTTKGGKKGGVQIDYSSNLTFESLEYKKFHDYQYEYGAGDYEVAPTTSDVGVQTDSYGGKLDGHSVPQYDGVSRPYVAVKNNLAKFYNTGNNWINTVGVSGGNDKTVWRISGSDQNIHGVMPNNALRRDNFAFNINSELTKRLILIANAKYINEKTTDRPILSDSPGNADYTLYTMPTSLSVGVMKANKQNAAGDEIPFSNNVYVTNPYWATENFTEQDTKARLITSLEPRFNVTDWLYVKGLFGFDRYNYAITSVIPTGTAFQPGGGYVHNTASYNQSNNGLFVGVDTKFGENFALNGFIGANKMSISQLADLLNDGTNSFNIPFFYEPQNISSSNLTVNHTDVEQRTNSVFASVDLSYKNYLYLNLTGRNDWFSSLTPPPGTPGKINNHIFYPSVGLSVVLSDAFKMPEFINYAKARASWAQVGGDLQPYQLSQTYALTGSFGPTAPLAQVNGSQIPNNQLQPYSSLSDEIGIESRWFNNRMGLDLTYYNHNISKDIISAEVSPTSGYQSAVYNIGKATNKGIEAQISYRIIQHRNFSYEPGLNFSYNKSNIVKLYGNLTQITMDNARSQTAQVADELGKPAAEVQAISFLRNSAGQIEYNAQGEQIPNGYKDMGTGVSPWVFGLDNAFHIHRFTLDILFDAKFGGVIFSGTNALAYRYGLSKGTLPGRDGGVVGVGVGPDGKTPNAVKIDATIYYPNMYNFGEPFVYSSDFIKLRSATLDYAFPGFGSKSPIKGLSLSLVGRNLWTLVKHVPNIDPESTYNNGNAQGLEFTGFPITRTFGANLNVKF